MDQACVVIRDAGIRRVSCAPEGEDEHPFRVEKQLQICSDG